MMRSAAGVAGDLIDERSEQVRIYRFSFKRKSSPSTLDGKLILNVGDTNILVYEKSITIRPQAHRGESQ
jgi:hypothetical protein